MVRVTCELQTYDEPAKHSIRVHSHWNMNDRVVIEVNGEKVTIIAKDMIAAVQNCTNTAED
jgi:hypothetical protein